MIVIPINPVPSQTMSVALNGQACQLSIYQKSTGMFMDVYVSGSPVVLGELCHDRCRIVRESYLGLVGDLVFFDTEGKIDPDYSGLGDRFILGYLTPAELA